MKKITHSHLLAVLLAAVAQGGIHFLIFFTLALDISCPQGLWAEGWTVSRSNQLPWELTQLPFGVSFRVDFGVGCRD